MAPPIPVKKPKTPGPEHFLHFLIGLAVLLVCWVVVLVVVLVVITYGWVSLAVPVALLDAYLIGRVLSRWLS